MWFFGDQTLNFMQDPYNFIKKRCDEDKTDIIETRIFLEKAFCMYGEDAALKFYDNNLFIRAGAVPEPIRGTLFGKGGIQALDGSEHQARKRLFMSVVRPESAEKLLRLTEEWFRVYVEKWRLVDEIVLYDEVHEILTGAACAWVGVPLKGSELPKHAKNFAAMFDLAAQFGFNMNHVYSRIARGQEERWIKSLVTMTRRKGEIGEPTSPFEQMMWYRDVNGQLLDVHSAAVEIINLIRPTVAISVDILYAAHALLMNRGLKERILAKEEGFTYLFAQEVRRFYPFFPILAARVKEPFEFKGRQFSKGRLVVLDVFGTNHDERIWKDPDVFLPDRFKEWNESKFNFIPQGGGDYFTNHRCPGEAIVIKAIELAARVLAELDYHLPQQQDLGFDWTRVPCIPTSKFILKVGESPQA